MHVGFTGTEITPFNSVVKETVNGIAVVLVIFRRIDTALGGNGVGSTWAVLIAEAINLVSELRKGGGSRTTGKARSDNDDFVFSFVGWVDELRVDLVRGPLAG